MLRSYCFAEIETRSASPKTQNSMQLFANGALGSCAVANVLAALSRKSTFQKALPADIAALEADALFGAFLLETTLAEAPAREVLHARLEKLKGLLDAHRRVGECLEVGDAWIFH